MVQLQLRTWILMLALSSTNLVFAQSADPYISSLKPPFQKADLDSAAKLLTGTQTAAFDFFKRNEKSIDVVQGKNYTHDRLVLAIYKSEIQPQVENNATPDWLAIEKAVKPYGKEGKEIVLKSKAIHYWNNLDITRFSELFDQYLSVVPGGAASNIFEVNNFAWRIFEQSTDKQVLSRAAKWSKVAIDNFNETAFLLGKQHVMDTYANLLYKQGDHAKAILIQQQAVAFAREKKADNEAELEETLNKMRAGKPTWPVAIN